MVFFTEVEQAIQKFIRNNKRLQIAKTILGRKNETKGITFPVFKAILIKII